MSSIDSFIPKMISTLEQKVNDLRTNYQHLAPEFHNDVQKILD